MAIGSNYNILLSLQFGDATEEESVETRNYAMSVTDLYAFDRIYIDRPTGIEGLTPAGDGEYSLLGMAHSGDIKEIVNMAQIPVDQDRQFEFLKEILKEVNTFLNTIITQRNSDEYNSSQRGSNILKLDNDWITKKLNS